MALQVAFQMDPIERIDIRGDSTFALMLEGQRRGHQLFYYTPNDLSMWGRRVVAHARAVEVMDEEGNHFRRGERLDQAVLLGDQRDLQDGIQGPPFAHRQRRDRLVASQQPHQ